MTSQPRRSEPLPLGDEDLPYSKGLMARALIATGVPADQAYGLARRIEVDLAEAGQSAATLERLRKTDGKDFAVVLFPHAGHGLLDTPPTDPRAMPTLLAWIRKHVT